MMKLKSIDILSVAKIFGISYLIIGIIALIAHLTETPLFDDVGAVMTNALIPSFGPASVIIFPILSGVIAISGLKESVVYLLPVLLGLGGCLLGVMAGFLYNLVSAFLGGIEIKLEDKFHIQNVKKPAHHGAKPANPPHPPTE